jgi:hypothetical protein
MFYRKERGEEREIKRKVLKTDGCRKFIFPPNFKKTMKATFTYFRYSSGRMKYILRWLML